MAISLKHTFQSAKADGADTTLVQPSNWNAEHTITAAAGKVLGRDTSGAGAVQELPIAVDVSGNVGIGTSAPASRLDIGGASAGQTLTFSNTGSNSGARVAATIQFKTGSGYSASFITSNVTGATDDIYDLRLYTANGGAAAERFRITGTGGITSSDLADAVGYKGLPQNAQTSSYTLALSDMGKHISITTGGVVIPANASVAFPIGAAISIFNNSGSNQTISITSDTLRQAGTANTGSRTLAQYGIATCVKVGTTTWVISGAGVS